MRTRNDLQLDTQQIRGELRGLSRADLLLIANRAVDLLPLQQVQQLLEGFVVVQDSEAVTPGLLDQVRAFHDQSCRGEYFDDSLPSRHDGRLRSWRTDDFLAEFHRLIGACLRETASSIEGFELLFDVLRRIDAAPDDVVYFAKEPGSFQVGVVWMSVLPAYFRSLAQDRTPAACMEVAAALIDEFVPHDKERYLGLARAIAHSEAPRA